MIFGFDGSHVRDVPVPDVSSLLADYDAPGFPGRPDSTNLHFVVTSFTDSGSLWEHDLGSGETRLLRPPAARVDPQALVSEQVFVTANDGVSIALFLTRRRDVDPNEDVPVLLYGYGGFDLPVTPRFNVEGPPSSSEVVSWLWRSCGAGESTGARGTGRGCSRTNRECSTTSATVPGGSPPRDGRGQAASLSTAPRTAVSSWAPALPSTRSCSAPPWRMLACSTCCGSIVHDRVGLEERFR